MSTANKLTYLNGTKQAIKNAINEDFEVIDDNTTFREYADEISSNNAKYKDLIPKETTNATNTLDISNSAGLNKALVTQYGNTYQETTTGKNLLPRLVEGTTVFNGKTYSVDENGILTMSGTPTGAGAVNIQFQTPYQITSETRYIYLLNDYKDGTFGVRIMNGNTRIFEIIPNPENRIVDLSQYSGQTITNIQIYQNLTFTATRKIYLMICTDNNQTTYEPYTNGASPNPDYPQEIVNISGKSTLKVEGKNLFDKDNVRVGYRFGSDGEYYADTGYNATEYIRVQPNTLYSVSWAILWDEVVCTYDINKNFVRRIQSGTNFTTSASEYYIRADVSDAHLSTAQIENSSTPTSYEPYQEQSYEINLGKNLFNYEDLSSKIQTFTINGNASEFTINGIGAYDYPISLIGQYTFSGNWSTTNLNGHVKVVYEDDTTGNLFSSYSSSSASGTINFTTTKNVKAIRFQTYNTNNITMTNFQIEKGSQATSYAPYKTPIELCKIGDYKDRIYPLNGKWYLEKNIGKVVLNGSETNWSYYSTGKYFLNLGIIQEVVLKCLFNL